MAGLLKQPRQQAQPQQAQPMPEQPQQMDPNAAMPQEPMPGQEMPQGAQGEADENNPAFQAAITQVKKALYKEGAADGVNQALTTSSNPVETVSTLAYELTAIADEKTIKDTGEKVPDELLMLLAGKVLAEIVDIAEGSGIQMSAADVAQAFKQMTLRYLGEQGMDTRELSAAVDQISPDQMNQLAAEVQ